MCVCVLDKDVRVALTGEHGVVKVPDASVHVLCEVIAGHLSNFGHLIWSHPHTINVTEDL